MKDVESTVSTEWTQWEEGGPDGGKGIVGAGWAGSHCFCICLSAVWALLHQLTVMGASARMVQGLEHQCADG